MPQAAKPRRRRRRTDTKSNTKKKNDKSSSIDDPRFIEGYRAAYATIYDRNDYAAAIEQLKALGQDDRADVANLIGYSYRKLGDYKVSQIWYERALKADPNHVRTWQYYGLWQLEQGNRDQAQYHLNRIGELVRHRLRGISLARRRAGKAARHRPRLLNSLRHLHSTGAAPKAAPVLFCPIDRSWADSIGTEKTID
jgi:tetratricopeptide (TPR) repeat protein